MRQIYRQSVLYSQYAYVYDHFDIRRLRLRDKNSRGLQYISLRTVARYVLEASKMAKGPKLTNKETFVMIQSFVYFKYECQ
jgi:hypothetical protein